MCMKYSSLNGEFTYHNMPRVAFGAKLKRAADDCKGASWEGLPAWLLPITYVMATYQLLVYVLYQYYGITSKTQQNRVHVKYH